MDGGGAGRLVAGSEGPHSGQLGGHAEHCGRAGASRSDRLSPRAGGAQPYDRGFNAMTGSQAEVGGPGAQRIGASGAWLSVLRRYMAVIAVGNLAWEFAKLPPYTTWPGGPPRQVAIAAPPCPGGVGLNPGAAPLRA